ncbi:phenylacetate--CoA ligase family protein, partial [Calditrichota bacterium]
MPLSLRRAYGGTKRLVSRHWLWDSKEFQNYFDFLQKSQWWSLEELKNYQLEQLKELVKFVYEKVPYYQRSFKEKRLKPSDIKTLDDLQLLPLITKEEVREHIDEFIPVCVDKSNLKMWVTGGTSGIPLTMYLDSFYSSMIEEAFSLRQRVWAGYKQYDRKMNLRRDTGGFHPYNKCWDYYNKENELVLNSHEMAEKNMVEFVKVINKFRPIWLVGFPSGLEVFARFIKRNNIDLPPIKAIFSGSEALYPNQRDFIESGFNSTLFSGYGMSERVVDAIECEQHSGYHYNMEYGILELLDENNEPIKEPGISGVVVGTGFHNNVMPLIRYQMFDVAVYADKKCACNRNLPLVKSFKGRIREYFVGRTGKLVPLQLIWSGRQPVWSKIQEMKYFQEREGKVVA